MIFFSIIETLLYFRGVFIARWSINYHILNVLNIKKYATSWGRKNSNKKRSLLAANLERLNALLNVLLMFYWNIIIIYCASFTELVIKWIMLDCYYKYQMTKTALCHEYLSTEINTRFSMGKFFFHRARPVTCIISRRLSQLHANNFNIFLTSTVVLVAVSLLAIFRICRWWPRAIKRDVTGK